MKKFSAIDDMKLIGIDGLSILLSHYAAETYMESDNEMLIDIGIGELYIKKSDDEFGFSFVPYDSTMDELMDGFSGKSNLLNNSYDAINSLIKGGLNG